MSASVDASVASEMMEGTLKVPHVKGIKAGWRKMHAAISGQWLCVFATDGTSPPQAVECVLDLRSPRLKVTSVTADQVIHAQRSDVPLIFRVEGGMGENDGARLFLAASVPEKVKWMQMLEEVHERAVKLADTTLFTPSLELGDVPVLKSKTLPVAVRRVLNERTGEFKTVVATADGLFLATGAGATNPVLKAKGVLQVELLGEKELIFVLSGKPASIRVYPLALLDRAPAWGLELEPTKQAHLFALGYDRRTQKRYLAVAVRRTRVVVLQIDDRGLFPKIAEAAMPDVPTAMRFAGSELFVTMGTRFRVIDVATPNALIMLDLPSREDRNVSWVHHSHGVVALTAFRVRKEYLLCYNVGAVYVDRHGRQSRNLELHWATRPLMFGADLARHAAIAVRNRTLIVFGAEFADFFSVDTGALVQRLPLAHTRLVDADGVLVCMDNDIAAIQYLGAGEEVLGDDEAGTSELDLAAVAEHAPADASSTKSCGPR